MSVDLESSVLVFFFFLVGVHLCRSGADGARRCDVQRFPNVMGEC